MEKKRQPVRARPKKKNPKGPANPTDQDGSQAVAHAVAALTNAIAEQQEANQHQRKRAEKHRKIIEVLGLVFVAATTGFVILQWYEMHRVYDPIAGQLEEMKEAQKPWIGVVEAVATIRPTVGQDFTVEVTVKNTGQGPAYDWGFRLWEKVLVREPGQQRACYLNPSPRSGISVPGQSATLDTRLSIDSEKLREWAVAKNGNLYIVGRVDYRDSDGPHCLTICMNYRPDRQRFGFGRKPGHELRHGEDCKRQYPGGHNAPPVAVAP